MAKRFDPYPVVDTPAGFGAVVRSYALAGVEVAKFAAAMPTMTPEQIAAMTQRYVDGAAAWNRLATWKKTRWTMCAIFTYGDFATLVGAAGMSGYTLYLKCWLEQQPAADHQPISPCSARATDPGASPWNYQP